MQKQATLIISHYITFCESKNMLLENCSCKCETNFILAIREISLLKELVHPNIVRLQVDYFYSEFIYLLFYSSLYASSHFLFIFYFHYFLNIFYVSLLTWEYLFR